MRERDRCIQVAELSPEITTMEMYRRIYSPDGLAPTIRTRSGGSTEPKILVSAQLPGYEKDGRIYDIYGISPTIQARDYKEPKKIVIGKVVG